MYRKTLVAGCLLGLSACTMPSNEDIEALRAMQDVNCSARPDNCRYENSPVRVENRPVTLPKRPYQFFPLAEPLRFTDAQERLWIAPPGTLTDGASIPKIFVSIVGNPTAPEYVNAAAVHDAYCGVGNEGGANFHNGRWEDVHRMFYDALVVAGTPEARAKVMFAAVWLGGPRWNVRYTLDAMPIATKQQAMAQAKAYIEANDPPLSNVVGFLERLEKRMLMRHPELYSHITPGGDMDHGHTSEMSSDYDDDYYDEYDDYDRYEDQPYPEEEAGDLTGEVPVTEPEATAAAEPISFAGASRGR